ncbi:hypothetical protein [Sphingobacterium thermophilum]|uniref:Uncharacterized protein n=1 Tax=Sphingobacterium thermophilum TaxID=768534 RepID=A0ABP8R1T3_9SPHI
MRRQYVDFCLRLKVSLLLKKDNKLFVDVNYLFASYSPVKTYEKGSGQNVDIVQDVSIDIELSELKSKIALYEQEIKHKDQLLNEKDGRIMDLQKAMLLLESPKEKEALIVKKKRWWNFLI